MRLSGIAFFVCLVAIAGIVTAVVSMQGPDEVSKLWHELRFSGTPWAPNELEE